MQPAGVFWTDNYSPEIGITGRFWPWLIGDLLLTHGAVVASREKRTSLVSGILCLEAHGISEVALACTETHT